MGEKTDNVPKSKPFLKKFGILIGVIVIIAVIGILATTSIDDNNTGGFLTSITTHDPVADFSYSISGSTVYFTDTSTDSDGYISFCSWSFGDGYTSAQDDPSHSYSSSGTYTVRFTVTDDDGNTDSYSKTITITNKPPTASFTFSKTDLNVKFTSKSSDSDGSISSYYWTFGDGQSATTRNPTHTYSKDGYYTVTLKVYDDEGKSDSTSKSIYVVELPDFQIIFEDKYDQLEGFNKVGYVDIDVTNYGSYGTKKIYVTVYQGSDEWTKYETVTLGKMETSYLSFRFAEIHFWTTDPWNFYSWVE